MARDRVVEFVCHMAILAGCLARIADEIRTLNRPEFGELSFVWHEGVMGSSTMPHKHNPEDCEQIIVLAKLVKTHATACFDTMTSDHERDYRGIHIEWVSVTDASHYCLKALELTQKVLKNVVVEEKIMHDRVVACREQLCTECLMLELGKHIGKQDAFAILSDI